MSSWLIVVPEAGTNYVLNPSAETTGSFADHNGGTVTRVTTWARFGDYTYRIATGAANRGINLTLSALPNAAAYVTFYFYNAGAVPAGTLQVSLDAGSNYNAASLIGGATGGWLRYGAAVAQAQANGSTALIIRSTADEGNPRIDAVQVESAAYYTTYIDGDLGSLYRWTGLRHGSTSTRDAQDRSGGRIRDLADDYGVRVLQQPGGGLPPTQLNLLSQALQPGALFQSARTGARTMFLTLDLHHTTLAGLHGRRQDLIDLFKVDAYRGAQPFILGYKGADSGTAVYASFYVADGLGLGGVLGGGTWIESGGRVPVALVAPDPYWYEDNRETASLDFTDSVASSAYANRRTNGQWLAMGSGMQSLVSCIVTDYQRGRVYFGGSFTTANGVTVNRITYWNGTTFVAMDSGVNNIVRAMALAANGDLWISGDFTTVGSGLVACKGLARWNVATSTWTAFANTTGSFLGIFCIVIDSSGNVFIGGDFTDWDGIAAADQIAKYDGATWTALGTSPFTTEIYPRYFQSMTFDASGNLWTGEYRESGTGTLSIRRWNGTTWTTVITTDSLAAGDGIFALIFAPDGRLFIGGAFGTLGGVTATNIAVYNGTAVAALGTSVNNDVYALMYLNGLLYAGGTFTSAGGLTLADRMAIWNGYTWFQFDIDLPGSPIIYALASYQNDLFIGYDTTGTATAAGLTTVSPTSTVPTFPTITLIGPSSASCTLQWLENQSSGHRLYFDLVVQSGETVLIDLTPHSKRIVSDWRGVIADQPLSVSDFAAWHLLPAPSTNTVAAFITGTTTAAELLMHWTPAHISIDGPG